MVGVVLLALIGVAARAAHGRAATDDAPLPAVQAQEEVAAEAAPTTSDAPETAVPTAAPTGEPTQYTVANGDTLWTIAVNHNVSMEAVIAANPQVNPDVLQPGEVLTLPAPGEVIQPTLVPPQFESSVAGTVNTDGANLRLRSEPRILNNIVETLGPDTPVDIVGRTSDSRWLQVMSPQGSLGWVMRRWVIVSGELSGVPVTGEPIPVEPTPVSPVAQPVGDYLYISNITDTSEEIYAFGQSVGNRPNVFSKVGDSITANNVFLKPIGLGEYDLRDYEELQPVVDFYLEATARDDNSFANTSLAAKGGWSAWHLTDPDSANAELCLPGETPLVCEYRLVQPAVALIMLGTNDVSSRPTEVYEGWMRQIVETSIDMGVIPVLSTIPAFHDEEVEGRVAVFNAVVVGLAQEYDVPLWDYWSAMQYLPNEGLSSDGVHPSWAVPADFTYANLQYGMPVRNLTALQALDAVWREVLS